MAIEKAELVRSAIKRLEENAVLQQASIEREKEVVRDAPTAMESRSDTTRNQRGRLIESLQSQYGEMQSQLVALRELRVEEKQEVGPGALVNVKARGGTSFFLIIPGAGGTLEFDDVIIEIISPASPVAMGLSGYKAGVTVEITVPAGIMDYEIIEVQ